MENFIPEFSVSADAHDGRTVVKVRGEIDACTAPEFSLALADALNLRPSMVLVDLSAVTFIDSAACHSLIRANRNAKAMAIALELAGVDGPKLLILEILGFDKVLTIRRP